MRARSMGRIEGIGWCVATWLSLIAGGCGDAGQDLTPLSPDGAVTDAAGRGDVTGAASAEVALDLPITADVARDAPMSNDVATEAGPLPGQDATVEVRPFDAANVEAGSICQSASRLFACMSDDTITHSQTWLVSRDLTVRGVVTLATLGAGANWCSGYRGVPAEAEKTTQSLYVRDETGHYWYPQYYVQSPRLPWQVGDAVDIRYQVTVAADGRPRRAMTLSSGGRVIVYVAEAVTLDDLPPAPVALRLGGTACPSSGDCGGGRYGLLAGTAGVGIPYGQARTVEGYWILNADCADVTAWLCDSQPSRISVAMVYEPAALDAGLD